MRDLESSNIGYYVINGSHILYFCSEWSSECKKFILEKINNLK